MKRLLILCFAVLLCGCWTQKNENTEILSPRIPSHILLSDKESHVVGIGVPIRDNTFVTADHLLQTSGDLFWKQEPIHVFARDFDSDLLFFELDRWIGSDVVWSDSPPVMGSSIFWIDGSSVAEEQVHSLAELGKEQIKKDVLVISGTADLPNSGSPVFDAYGKIFGVLVGGDMTRKVSFALRSDVIQRILEENME